jgi:hypothetical protein
MMGQRDIGVYNIVEEIQGVEAAAKAIYDDIESWCRVVFILLPSES